MAEPRPQTSAHKQSNRTRRRARSVPRKVTRVLALELDAGALCVAEAVRRGRHGHITRTSVLRLPADGSIDPYDPQASGAWIGSALKEAGYRSAPVVVCVPRRKVILKSLSLPPGTAENELVSMVHLQLSKDLTFPVDEAIVDFVTYTRGEPAGDTSSRTSPRGTNVVVGAMKRDLVTFFQNQAQAAGIRLHGIGLRSYGNVRYPEYCDVVPKEANAGVISLQGYEVMVDILEGGQLAFSRAAAIEPSRVFQQKAGGIVEDAGSGYTSALATEVVRTLQSYSHADRPSKIGRMFVGGATGVEPELVGQLAERLRQPCELLDPPKSMGLTTAEEVSAARACMGPIGLALTACERPRLAIDFLRPKEPAKKPGDSRVRKLLVGTAGVAAMLCVIATSSRYVQSKRQGIPEFERQIAALSQKQKAARRDLLRDKLVGNWMGERGEWLDHWAYLSAALPSSEDIYVTEVRTGAKGRLWLSLRARSGELLSTLDGQLRAAGYQVSPLAVTPGRDPFGYDFKTTVELVIDSEAKVETADGERTTLREAVEARLTAFVDGKSTERGHESRSEGGKGGGQ